jgi:hypothetical protein
MIVVNYGMVIVGSVTIISLSITSVLTILTYYKLKDIVINNNNNNNNNSVK